VGNFSYFPGGYPWGGRGPSNIFRQRQNGICPRNTVFEVVPEGDPVFATSFFQAREDITTSSPQGTSGAATDFSFRRVFPDIVFTQVVVKRKPRLFQDRQEFSLIAIQPLKGLIKRGKTCAGGTRLHKLSTDQLDIMPELDELASPVLTPTADLHINETRGRFAKYSSHGLRRRFFFNTPEPDSSTPNRLIVLLPRSIPIRTIFLLTFMLDPPISFRWIIPFTIWALLKPV
jgi:hypothetical protein